MNIGIQILSLRAATTEFASQVEQAGKLGFDGLELLQWGPHPSPNPSVIQAEQAKAVLEENEVYAASSHFRSVTDLEANFAAIVDYHRRLGVTDMVVTAPEVDVYLNAQDPAVWSKYGESLNTMGHRLLSEGFSLGFHNHVIELLPVEGVSGLDRLFAECDPEAVFWQTDIGHIEAAHGKLSDFPSVLLDRLRSVHVKDLSREVRNSPVPELGQSFATQEDFVSPIRDRLQYEVALGEGVIELDSAIDTARVHGAEWMIVEFHKTDLDLTMAAEYIRDRLPC